jgi:hypothetical protein
MYLSPFATQSLNDQTTRQRDLRVASERQTRDDQGDQGVDGQQQYFNAVNDAAQDAATGPGGYNRQWVPLLESLQGKKVNWSGSGLPTETYGDADPVTHVLQRRALPANAGTPTVTMPSVSMPNATDALQSRAMPPDQAAFEQQLYNTPTKSQKAAAATAARTHPPTPRTVLPTPGPIPTMYEGPTSADALTRRLYGG